jgi:hypothetical protein
MRGCGRRGAYPAIVTAKDQYVVSTCHTNRVLRYVGLRTLLLVKEIELFPTQTHVSRLGVPDANARKSTSSIAVPNSGAGNPVKVSKEAPIPNRLCSLHIKLLEIS